MDIQKLPKVVMLNVLNCCNVEDVPNLLKTSKYIRSLFSTYPLQLIKRSFTPINLMIMVGKNISISEMIVADSAEETESFEKAERQKDCQITSTYTLKKSEFQNSTIGLCIAPRKRLFLKMACLDDETMDMLILLNTDLSKAELVLITDKIELSTPNFRRLLQYLNPVNIHFAGKFNRSILTDNLISGLHSLKGIFIQDNSCREQQSRITSKTLNLIATNFSKGVRPIRRSEEQEHCIVLPNDNIVETELEEFMETFADTAQKCSKLIMRIYGVNKKKLDDISKILQRFGERQGVKVLMFGTGSDGERENGLIYTQSRFRMKSLVLDVMCTTREQFGEAIYTFPGDKFWTELFDHLGDNMLKIVLHSLLQTTLTMIARSYFGVG